MEAGSTEDEEEGEDKEGSATEASHEATTATKCWALQFIAWRAGEERAGAGFVKRRRRRRRRRRGRVREM